MSGPWEDYQQPAATGPWDDFQPEAPAQGVGKAFMAGLQGSSGGLAVRGKLPDIHLDHESSAWYERLAHGAGGFVGDIPAGIVGLVGGGAAGTAAAPGVGTAIGAGAGMMAVPAAIREAYMQAYTKGEIANSGDFLARTGLVLASAGKAGVVGAVTGGVGKYVGIGMTAAGVGAGTKAIAATGAEATAATVSAAALEGRLPDLQDWMDNAIFIAGMKGVAHTPAAVKAVSDKFSTIYRQTGKTPMEVMADASKDPSIVEDLGKDIPNIVIEGQPKETFYHGTKEKFDTFDPTLGSTPGSWFTKDQAAASSFGEAKAYTVDVKNPASMADLAEARKEAAKSGLDPMQDQQAFNRAVIDNLEAKGFDGIRDSKFNGAGGKGENVVAAFRAEQIKPADPLAPYEKTAQDSGIPEAYRGMAAETFVSEAMPTEKLKAVIDKPFADIPDVKMPEGLNLKYFENFDQLEALDARMTEVFKDEINAQRGGTQKWADIVSKGEDLLRTAAGEEAVSLLRREAGTTDNSAKIYARGALMTKALTEAQEAVKTALAAPEEVRGQMMADAMAKVNTAAVLKANFTGASAELGRAMGFLRYMKDASKQVDAMDRVMSAFSENPEVMMRAMANADTMAEFSALVGAATKPDFFAKYMDYRRASLMSGYLTVARNTFGGALMLGKNVMVDAYSALSSKLTPGADPVPFSKAAGRLTGYTLAAGTMFKEAARTFREAESIKEGVKDLSTTAWESAVEKSGGVKPLAVSWEGNLIEKAAYLQAKGVFGANTLIDGMMRNFGFYGEVYSRAAEEAVSRGLTPGSKQFMDYLQDRVSNLTEKDTAAGNKTGAEVVFAGETGPLLGKVYKTLNEWKYLKAIVPFVGVPGKMLEAGSRLSPFAPLVKSWRDDVAAGGERAQRANAEAALGQIMWATTANMFRDEAITGYGPAEPDKRAVWLMTHQPYSIKIGDNWYNYGQALQPIGPMLGMVADTMQLFDHMTPEEQRDIPKYAFLAFKNSIGNATMLQGASDFFSIFTDEGSMMKFMRNFTVSNLPAAGFLGNVAQGLDPYQREVNNIFDAIRSRIPFAREGLNAKIDALGNPVAEPDKLTGVIPSKSVPVNTDKAATEAARLRIGVGKIPDYIELPAGKDKNLGRVELTPAEKDTWAKNAGQMANAILQGSVNAPDWDTLPDQTQRIIMKAAFDRAREYGRKTMMSPERLQTEFSRIGQGVERNFSQQK